VADWHWEPHPRDLLDGLPQEASKELDLLAREIAVRDSMTYLDGRNHEGPVPGLRTETRGRLMVTYLTDVRGERVVVLQVTWFG
jgi:plasmid stabilization system protein ParE